MRRLVIVALLPLIACSQSSDPAGATATGSGTSRMYEVTGFTGIALESMDDVDVRVGSGFSVRADGPAAVLDTLRIYREGDVLHVARKKGFTFEWREKPHVKVFVTMPRITGADLAGSGDLAIDHVEGERFHLASAGSGDTTIGALGVQSAELSLAGSGGVSAQGTVRSLVVNLAGSGDVDAGGLKATSATVSATGSGSIHVTVNGTAQVSSVGSGDVDLGPGAHCTTQKTGSGEVHCG